MQSVGTWRSDAVNLAAAMNDQFGLVVDAQWLEGPPSGGIGNRRWPSTGSKSLDLAENADVCAEVPPVAFGDLASIAAVHLDNVTCMAGYGITVGVDDVPNFAPGQRVTRQQMATFVMRTANLLATVGRWNATPGTPADDDTASLRIRRLPGWWAADTLIDAFETGEAWFQGFDGVQVRDLQDDPRFPDAERAFEVRSTIIANLGGPTPDGGPWAWGDDRRYLLDHGDHVAEIAWESRVTADRWEPFTTAVVVDEAGVAVTDSLRVRAEETALLPEPADPRAVDWANATITYRGTSGTGAGVPVTLTDGGFDGIGPDGTPDSRRQLDIPSLVADTERLVAVRSIVFEVAGDGDINNGLFQAGETFTGVQ